MISAIVLAAGMSSRYGSQNKLLLPFGEGSVVRCTVQAVLQTKVDQVLVITGHDCEKIEAALIDLPVSFVYNPQYREGEMLSSIQTGLRYLGSLQTKAVSETASVYIDATMIVLGDQPLLPVPLMKLMMRAFDRNCGEIIAPRFQNLRGHPVLMARKWWANALAIPPGHNLRDLLKAHPEAVSFIQVNSDIILRDVDTPEAYVEVCELAGV